jgi:1-deoxyxylulose-5-phosphate synthase
MSFGSPDWQRWTLPYEMAVNFVKSALDAGINFFDTADFYSFGESEEFLGRAIQELTRRDHVVISTKVGLPMSPDKNDVGLSRKHIVTALDASLRRLKTDYVDIYMLHDEDLRTPIEETMSVMSDLVRTGKVLYIGFSNLPAWKAAHCAYFGKYSLRVTPRVAQIQYNLCYREDERDLLPMCRHEGLGVMAYSPLARGFLAGNRVSNRLSDRDALRASTDAKAHSLYGTAQDQAVLSTASRIATRLGVPVSRVAMSWVLSNSSVSTIICGVLEESHLSEAVASVDLQLSQEDLEELNRCYSAQPLKTTGLNAVMANVVK